MPSPAYWSLVEVEIAYPLLRQKKMVGQPWTAAMLSAEGKSPSDEVPSPR